MRRALEAEACDLGAPSMMTTTLSFSLEECLGVGHITTFSHLVKCVFMYVCVGVSVWGCTRMCVVDLAQEGSPTI